MRAAVVLLGCSTTILGATCAYLLWRDGAASEGAVAATDVPAETRVDALIAERDRLRRQIDRGQREVPCEEPAAKSARGAQLEGAAGNPGLASVRGGVFRSSPLEQLAPEHRRTLTRQRYGTLFHELALSDAQIDALLPILGAHDERSLRSDSPETPVPESDIAAVLGAENASRFAALQRSMPARLETRMLTMQLEHAGAPLSEAQERQLVAAMKDLGPAEPPPLGAGASALEARERFRTWRAERAKVVRELAAPVLTPRQLQRLEESEALQTAMQAALPPPAAPP